LLDIFTRFFLCHLGYIGGVSSHVGDQTCAAAFPNIQPFIQLLSNGHGSSGSISKFTGCFLLHGAGYKWGKWFSPPFAALDSSNRICRSFHIGNNRQDSRLIRQFRIHSVNFCQFGNVCGPDPLGFKFSCNCPVFHWNKSINFAFPLNNQPQRNRLNPSRRKTIAHFFPKDGTDAVTHQAVQNSPGLLGIHKIHVNFPWMRKSILNRGLGDFMEYHPLCQPGLNLGCFHQVPGNSFSFPVRVGCQVYFRVLAGKFLQLLDHLFFLVGYPVLGGEVIFHIHRKGRAQQITHMSN